MAQVVNATPKRSAYDYYVQAREQYLLFTIEGYARAVPLFEKALEADPNYALACAGLAETFSMWGYQKEYNGDDPQPDYRRALEYARTAVGLAPGLGDAHRALSAVYSHLTERGQADPDRRRLFREEARKAVELNPRDAEAHWLLWGALGNPLDGDGYAYIRKALQLNPRLVAAWGDLGLALANRGKLDQAIANYRTAIEINPRFAPAYYNLGLAFYNKGKLEEAIDSYRKAIEINPRHGAAHCNLGVALYRQGKLDEAISSYRKAIGIYPRDAYAFYALGFALKQQGKREEAIAAFEEYLKLTAGVAAQKEWIPKAEALLKELRGK